VRFLENGWPVRVDAREAASGIRSAAAPGCALVRPLALGESGEPLRLRKTLPGCGKNQLADRRRIIIG